MAQYFYINKNSVNPTLRMELVDDGKYDFFTSHIFNTILEDSDITFSMWDENNVLKISKQPCNIFVSENSGCEPRYVIEYKWKKRDTKNVGTFTGRFEIKMNGDVLEDGMTFPEGNLILPIYEELKITIK